MPDVVRWILAALSSIAVAVLVFLLATVGIVVAFFVFLVLFVVVGLALRRMKKNVRYGEGGSRVIFYTNIPEGFGQAEARQRKEQDDPNTYELSPDEYTVTSVEKGEDTDSRRKALGADRPGS